MSEKTANILILHRCDLAISGRVFEYSAGETHLVPEWIADRLVSSGCGERIKERGMRLSTQSVKAHENK